MYKRRLLEVKAEHETFNKIDYWWLDELIERFELGECMAMRTLGERGSGAFSRLADGQSDGCAPETRPAAPSAARADWTDSLGSCSRRSRSRARMTPQSLRATAESAT